LDDSRAAVGAREVAGRVKDNGKDNGNDKDDKDNVNKPTSAKRRQIWGTGSRTGTSTGGGWALGGVAGEEVADEGGGALAEVSILGAEGGGEVAVDVQLANNLAGGVDGDDDFGLCLQRAGEVAGIVVDVIDNHGLAGGGGGTADSLVELNAGMRRHRAAKGAEDENGGRAGKFLDHVEADPVVAQHVFVKQLDDAFEKVTGGVGRRGESTELLDALRVGEGSPHGWNLLP